MAILSKSLLAGAVFTSLASALPQKPDFAAIAAAPTVADGPSDVATAGDQTATLATSFTVAGPTSAPSAAAASKRSVEKRTNILSSIIDTTMNAVLGAVNQVTSVSNGAEVLVDGGSSSSHVIDGNLDNKGKVYIGQSCYWDGHDSNNGNLQNAAGALFQLNNFGSSNAPTYDWNIKGMKNDGVLQWCGRGDTGGSKYQLEADDTSYNNGLISFEQFFGNQGGDFCWKNSDSSKWASSNLYNNGAFRLINVTYHNVQNILGNGCWQLGQGSVFYLEDGTGTNQNLFNGPSLPGQSIIFQHASSVLHLEKQSYSSNPDFGAKLYNFGKGNAIEFADSIYRSSYSASSGIMSLSFGWFGLFGSCKLNIGKGYDSSKFAKRTSSQSYGNYNAIFYDGVAPAQAAPSQCSLSAPVCSAKPKPTTSATSTAKATATSAPATTAAPVTTAPAVTPKTCTNEPYTPYYAALETGYTTNPALTGTTTAGQACPTTPEDGTYCGFINPEDPCAPQPDGYGPVPTPDTASAFLAYDKLHALASAAPSVVSSDDAGAQYEKVFEDLDASTSAQSYLGLYQFKEYDVAQCAAKCDCTELCTSFNL